MSHCVAPRPQSCPAEPSRQHHAATPSNFGLDPTALRVTALARQAPCRLSRGLARIVRSLGRVGV